MISLHIKSKKSKQMFPKSITLFDMSLIIELKSF